MARNKEYIHKLEEFALPDSSFLEGLLIMELTQSNDCIPSVRRLVKEEHFSDDTNRRLWINLLRQWDREGRVDMVSVIESLPSSKRANYMKLLTDAQFSYGPQIEKHAALLADTYAKRQIYLSCLRLIQEVSSPEHHGDSLTEMENAAKAIRENITDTSTPVTIQEAFNRYASQLEEEEALARQGKAIRVGTGFPTLDNILTGGFNKGELVILAARPSVGKAQPVDTEVLTPDGYRRMGDIRVGDEVIGKDGRPQKVLGVFPQGDRPTYSVTFNDRTSVLCDEEHIWTVVDQTCKNKGWHDLTLKEMMARGFRSHQTPSRKKSGRKGVTKYRIPVVSPVEFSEKELPINPYTLGVMLGDGCLTGNNVLISNPFEDSFIIEKVEKALAKEGYSLTVNTAPACPQYSIVQTDKGGKNGYVRKVKALGIDVLSGYKSIPAEYLHGSVEQRLELLRGLMDTDGTMGESSPIFCSSSYRLAREVAELVRSLGGIARLNSYEREGKSVSHVVRFRIPLCPFSLPRKADKWRKPESFSRYIVDAEYVGMQENVCIYVSNDDHLYVTENYTVTHNTALLLQMSEYASRIGYPTFVFSLEMTVEQLAKRMLLSKERLDAGDINRGRIDWERFNASFDDFNGVQMMIDDEPTGLDRLTSVLTIAVQQGKCRMALIDYLQLMQLPEGSRGNMNNAIGEITAALKRLAKRLGIPIILLSQLSRESVRDNRAPMLHDLRDSGNIEQDADTVLMLERIDYPDGGRGVRVWVRKNRNGRAGDISVDLVANNTFTRFIEYTGVPMNNSNEPF